LRLYFPADPVIPIKIEHVMLFLAYCSSKGLAYSTVSSYISVLNYVQKLSGFEDVSGNFVVKKMLQGPRKTTAKSDLRLPITHSILKSLIRSLEHLNFSYFLIVLMKAMYLTAFYAFLRIGEITCASTPVNNIQWQSVQFLLNDNQIPYAFELNMEKLNTMQEKHVINCKCNRIVNSLNFVLFKHCGTIVN
jgi:hypothetical protein